MSTPFLSVVIPAYNEGRRILPTLQRVTEYLKTQAYTWTVLVVDDGSTDGTARVVEEFVSTHPTTSLLSMPHAGKGWAVRTGMLYATGEHRFLCDADLSMPIEQLDRFLPPQLTDFDIAVGSREAPGARRFNEPYLRHFQGRMFNLYVRLLAVPGVNDTQCGFKCFRDEVAQELFSLQRFPGWSFDVEVLFLAQRLGLRIAEVPIDWHHHRDSRGHRLRDGIDMGWDALRLRWNAWRGKYGRLKSPSATPMGHQKRSK